MTEKFRDLDRGADRSERGASDCCGRSRSRDRGNSARTELLKRIQQLNFMMIEAGLFLNNQCDCEAAQVAFCDYQRRHAEARAEYEECYGPLTYEGVDIKSDGWSWMTGPWPWEVEDC